MGQIKRTFIDKLIPEICDRDANRVRVYEAPNGEVTIHFRNLKIVLHTREEIAEWKNGFQLALHNLGDNFINDI